MSSVYVSEPPTSGKVIFDTTHGPLEIQLWCRECPMTTRFFLQLCLDRFYDGMLFHRIVPSFLIQTGAMRQGESATGASSLLTSQRMKEYRDAVRADYALERRKLELHSRIRFSHRGQVSMALPVDDDDDSEDLQPQFFVTLEESRNLDGKYVLFGTVNGPTYFNASRIGSLDVDLQTNQPADLEHAPRVLSVKIVDNPIHQDLVPQQRVPWRMQKDNDAIKPKKKKRKGKFDKNMLSFGDEVEDTVLVAAGIKSRSDGNDGRERGKGLGSNDEQETAASSLNDPPSPSHLPSESSNKMSQIHHSFTGHHDDVSDLFDLKYNASSQRQAPQPVAGLAKEEPTSETSKQETRSILEIRNAKYKRSKSNKKEKEGDTLAKLFAFKKKVKGQVASTTSAKHEDNSLAARMARRAEAESATTSARGATYDGQVFESDEEEQDRKKQDWLTTKFKCRRHMDHTAGGDGRHMDEYEVVDPHGGDRGKHHRTGDEHCYDKRDQHLKKHKSHR